jgi:hypothetical protein
MKNLIELAKTYLKKVFSDLHNVIIGVVVGALIVGGGGIYLSSQKLWTLLTNIAQTPTPLWATAVLVLLATAYIHSKKQINLKDTSSESIGVEHKKIDPRATLSEKSVSMLQSVAKYENHLKMHNPGGFFIVDELEFSKALELSPQEIKYHLEQLELAGCIEEYPSGNYGGLTSKGRELLHEEGLLP